MACLHRVGGKRENGVDEVGGEGEGDSSLETENGYEWLNYE